jgi:hypothetical protein
VDPSNRVICLITPVITPPDSQPAAQGIFFRCYIGFDTERIGVHIKKIVTHGGLYRGIFTRFIPIPETLEIRLLVPG